MARWRIQVLKTTYDTYVFEADTSDADAARKIFEDGVIDISHEQYDVETVETLDPEMIEDVVKGVDGSAIIEEPPSCGLPDVASRDKAVLKEQS